MELALSGGGSFAVTPLAGTATYEVSSSWRDPSFDGTVLPSARELTEDGFSARWESTAIGMGLPGSWTSAPGTPNSYGGRMIVELYQPVSSYQQTERSVKYGALFVLLPFVALFLLETFTGIRVHPVQYLLVAAAKIVFYLLLLSLSEQLPFALAYAIGAAATTTLLTSYVLAFTRKRSHGLAMGAMIAGEYLFLFAALQSQDYALLIGSLALFAVLGAMMISTRRVDWYAGKRA
jgi:inner membrane protein